MGEPGTPHPFGAQDEISRVLMPSRLAERESAIQGILEKLAASGCKPDAFLDRLAIDELLANAVLHGNRGDPNKVVTIRAFCREDRWGVEVADEGPGFDWETFLRKLDEPKDPLRPSGRGLQLILASGAELHFLNGGSRVVFVRKRC